MDFVLTIYRCLLLDMHCFYQENKLSVPPLGLFRIRSVKFLRGISQDSCFWTMCEQSSVASGKWLEMYLWEVAVFFSFQSEAQVRISSKPEPFHRFLPVTFKIIAYLCGYHGFIYDRMVINNSHWHCRGSKPQTFGFRDWIYFYQFYQLSQRGKLGNYLICQLIFLPTSCI